VDGDGVTYTNITFTNWHGGEADGSQRAPIRIVCPDAVPCTDITISDWALWTESGDEQLYECESAYGDGFCLQDSDSDVTSYAKITSTATAAPSGYSASTMAADLSDSFGTTASIPIPTIPTSFFPGQTPVSQLAGSS
jgi:rhamnogalacturonan hydrolase